MSRIISTKTIITAFLIAILMLSLSSPVLAVKEQPFIVLSPGQASPGASPLPPGQDIINVTPGSLTSPGHGKIGNLHAPPVIIKNLTQKIKNQVNDIRVNQARVIAEGRINLIIAQLQLYERWVSSSGIDSDQKADILAIVESNIAWFRQQFEDMEAAADLAAIQALAEEADQQASALKVAIKKEAGILACERLNDRIATAQKAGAAIADKIATLKAQGKDTAPAEQKLADYNVHLDAAARYSAAALNAFEGITGTGNMDRGFNDGYRQIAQADHEMTKAYVDLKGVYLWYLQTTRQSG